MLYYTYDNLDRLTRENNSKLEKTFTYEYDAGGNITSKKEYAYTTGTLGTATATYNYAYGNAKWKDQLTSWNGTGITYDACGNPLSYKGATLAWTRGRLLNSYTKSGVTSTFTYNAQGIRTSKKVGTTTTTYTLEGNRILSDGTLTYIYNHSGLVGFKRGLVNYYYLKNVFGDITAIYNHNNVLQAKYHYDAWGNCTVQNVVGTVGNENPFRYRGYFWDNDLQLYYCQSRYYDPQVGRWLNPDTLDYLEPAQLNGLNLYAYCGNNPVMYADPSGHFGLLFWLCVAIGVGIGAGLAYDLGSKAGYSGWELVGLVALGGLTGGVIGAAVGGLLTIAAPAIDSFLSSSFTFGLPSLSMSGGAAALTMTQITVTGLEIAEALVVGIGLVTSFARTGRSNGYWGEKWPGDHNPDHAHLKGEDGTNTRIDRNGNPLKGEPSLKPQQRRAIRNLLKQIQRLFGR